MSVAQESVRYYWNREYPAAFTIMIGVSNTMRDMRHVTSCMAADNAGAVEVAIHRLSHYGAHRAPNSMSLVIC
jgi:hypothetical protein